MSDRLLQLETDLKTAVTHHRYSDVQSIAADFCARAAEEWRAFPAGDPRARDIFDRLQRVLEWARLMLCASRASVEGELRRALLSNRYLRSAGTAGTHLRYDG